MAMWWELNLLADTVVLEWNPVYYKCANMLVLMCAKMLVSTDILCAW